MSVSFANELSIMGYKGDIPAFEQLIRGEWNEHYSSHYVTVEEFLFHPLNCIKFCDDVRLTSATCLPTASILRKLNNMRKQNQL